MHRKRGGYRVPWEEVWLPRHRYHCHGSWSFLLWRSRLWLVVSWCVLWIPTLFCCEKIPWRHFLFWIPSYGSVVGDFGFLEGRKGGVGSVIRHVNVIEMGRIHGKCSRLGKGQDQVGCLDSRTSSLSWHFEGCWGMLWRAKFDDFWKNWWGITMVKLWEEDAFSNLSFLVEEARSNVSIQPLTRLMLFFWWDDVPAIISCTDTSRTQTSSRPAADQPASRQPATRHHSHVAIKSKPY